MSLLCNLTRMNTIEFQNIYATWFSVTGLLNDIQTIMQETLLCKSYNTSLSHYHLNAKSSIIEVNWV